MTDQLITYCPGTNCPLKEHCLRYRVNIDIKKEDNFPWAPFNKALNKCEHYKGDPVEAVKQMLNNSIDQSEPKDGAYCQ